MAVTLIGILFLAVQLWTFTWILQLQEDDGNHLLSSSSSSSSSSKRRKTATHSLLEQWKPENNCNQTNPHNNDRNAKNMMAAMMPHFDIAQELKDYQNLPVLVVGGTDGSGTRAVTAMLQTMGVPVVSDDPVTLDVHAAEIFCGQGWPALVELVLSYTNNHDGSCCGNYEWGDLPQEVQELLEREITTLLDTWETKYQVQLHLRKLQEHHLRKIITYPNERIIQRATNVKFAIKAPVSMLLLPVLTKIMGKIQFLHVLRE